jgi:sulfofructose kinase
MPCAPLWFVGQTVLDQVWHIHSFSALGDKGLASAFDSRIGGLAGNAAVAAHALRDQQHSPSVRLFSALGDDAAGQRLARLAAASGLDTHGVACIAGARSPVSAVLIDERGERQVHNFRGDVLGQAPLPPWPTECGGVMADPRWPAAAKAALTLARARGVVSVFDAEAAEPSVLRALVPLAQWCVFSRAGLAAWAADDRAAPSELLQRVALAAPDAERVVTLGVHGALWLRPDGQTHRLPAFDVKVLDSNGAGDVMHGVLLLSLAEGLPGEQALRRAMAAAALSCRGSLPDRQQLDSFLRERA